MSLKKKLDSLAAPQKEPKQSLSSLVRENLVDIEATIARGVPLEAIRQTLEESMNGEEVKIESLRSALSRARDDRDGKDRPKSKGTKKKTEAKAADAGLVSRATVPVVEPKQMDEAPPANQSLSQTLREFDQRNESPYAVARRKFENGTGKT
ncbi:hypothetical protein G3N59_05580 [Paraburkholderia sp. Ac-20340]|uniref:hypothetical protein n=1 Tax=Paraburkholderia sp. Ac-20340 TaxID=2703888 RepID=UPI0019814F26|nr:hypothetical protein [Paraburkholderia sp. Ac-20340]MBN3852846.1 hypothetical protein [Paraburkholderia sp. Ac-20340]